jgi:hypothetical protein
MIAFHIGEEESEYVSVTILRANNDGWFSGMVELAVGSFRSCYSADFNSWAFSNFLKQLENMHKSVSGSAVFTSYEGQLELVLECNPQGHIRLQGEAMDFAGTGNKLTFCLGLDQTYVPKIISSLQAALEQYPVHTF